MGHQNNKAEALFFVGTRREIRILLKAKGLRQQGLRREFANSGSGAIRLRWVTKITRRKPCFLISPNKKFCIEMFSA